MKRNPSRNSAQRKRYRGALFLALRCRDGGIRSVTITSSLLLAFDALKDEPDGDVMIVRPGEGKPLRLYVEGRGPNPYPIPCSNLADLTPRRIVKLTGASPSTIHAVFRQSLASHSGIGARLFREYEAVRHLRGGRFTLDDLTTALPAD